MLIAVNETISYSSPTVLLVDFKKSAMNGFSKKKFTQAFLSGYYIHLCQSLLGKINEVGVETFYDESLGIVPSLQMAFAIVFPPHEEIEPTFDLFLAEFPEEVELLSLGENFSRVENWKTHSFLSIAHLQWDETL